ncbi:MAG: hypothetical protein EOP12_02145 [Pseudomonas sp.]|jgi:hypothetical protein|nr:MAG: hypothetical protein EOP12_02145 [Pseudomonas sp.]
MSRILVYKRTHPHDPGIEGVFGNQDCMGQVREFDYDVVVGIGGIGAEACSHGIDRRLNWIGIGRISGPVHPKRNHLTFTFAHLVLQEHTGDYFAVHCPQLAGAMYKSRCRFHLNHTAEHMQELERLVAWAKRKAGPSGLYVAPDLLLQEETDDNCPQPDCPRTVCTPNVRRPRGGVC